MPQPREEAASASPSSSAALQARRLELAVPSTNKTTVRTANETIISLRK
jgi:hypothetical protein